MKTAIKKLVCMFCGHVLGIAFRVGMFKHYRKCSRCGSVVYFSD